MTIPPGIGTGELDFSLRYKTANTAGDGLKMAVERGQ